MSSVNNSPEINGLFPVPVVRYNYIEELNDLEIECINKELDIDISATNNYNNQNW